MNILHTILVVIALLLLVLAVIGTFFLIDKEIPSGPKDAAVGFFLDGFFIALIVMVSPVTTLGIIAVAGLALTVASSTLRVNRPPRTLSPGSALVNIALFVVVALALLGV